MTSRTRPSAALWLTVVMITGLTLARFPLPTPDDVAFPCPGGVCEWRTVGLVHAAEQPQNPKQADAETDPPPRPSRPQREFAPQYAPLVLLGVFSLFWGFWAMHKASTPWQYVGAVAAPVGLLTALLGALLWSVPHFFSAS